MKITKKNYEEFALDYIEDTLPMEDRKAFGEFLDAHPEIAEEIRELQQGMPVLMPDLSIRFEDKHLLKRRAAIRPWIIRIAAAAAVLLIGVMVFTRIPSSPEQPAPDLLATDRVSGDDTTPAVSSPVPGTEEPKLVAEAVNAPVPKPVKTPEQRVTPTVNAKRPELTTDPGAVKAPGPRSEQLTTLETNRNREVDQIREVFTIVRDESSQEILAHLQFPEDGISEQVELATIPVERVISQTEELVIEPIDDHFFSRSARDYFAEESASDQAGFLNILNRKGFKRITSGILTPISSLSPIRVRETNEERVIEFASIPISRKSNQPETEETSN